MESGMAARLASLSWVWERMRELAAPSAGASCAASSWRPWTHYDPSSAVGHEPQPPERKAMVVLRCARPCQEPRSRTLWKSARRQSASCTQR
eukprot:4790482-Pyramimonas_sp.AAC.1